MFVPMNIESYGKLDRLLRLISGLVFCYTIGTGSTNVLFLLDPKSSFYVFASSERNLGSRKKDAKKVRRPKRFLRILSVCTLYARHERFLILDLDRADRTEKKSIIIF